MLTDVMRYFCILMICIDFLKLILTYISYLFLLMLSQSKFQFNSIEWLDRHIQMITFTIGFYIIKLLEIIVNIKSITGGDFLFFESQMKYIFSIFIQISFVRHSIPRTFIKKTKRKYIRLLLSYHIRRSLKSWCKRSTTE